MFSELASFFSVCPDVNFADSSLTLSSFRVLTARCLELLLSLPVFDLFTSFHDSFRCRAATAGDVCTSPEVYALDHWPTGVLSEFAPYYHLRTQCLFCQAFSMSVIILMLHCLVTGLCHNFASDDVLASGSARMWTVLQHSSCFDGGTARLPDPSGYDIFVSLQ